MQYIISILWDEPDACPFGETHDSKPLTRKDHAWQYVQRVIRRAKMTGVQLHNVMVWTVNRGSRKCVWCLNDPRKYGDPWPTWDPVF